jgi:iojap-like ribosome-associated protein
MDKSSKQMVKIAYDALSDKKGEEIKIIDISAVSVIADYFVIASASNYSQLQALVDEAQDKLFKAGYEMRQLEGYHNNNWVLIDFNDIIIHIFIKEDRSFYDLERLWKDGKIIEIDAL